jgi:hypothetical protein
LEKNHINAANETIAKEKSSVLANKIIGFLKLLIAKGCSQQIG